MHTLMKFTGYTVKTEQVIKKRQSSSEAKKQEIVQAKAIRNRKSGDKKG